MLQRIKSYFYRRHLKQRMRSHSVSHAVWNMDTAKRVGILFIADDFGQMDLIEEYANKLRAQKKDVEILGYMATVIQQSEDVIQLNFPVFSKNDVNWYGVPRSENVLNFMTEEFDILLNVYVQPLPALTYISTFSKASYRVGPYIDGLTHCYDFMVQTSKSEQQKVSTSEPESSISVAFSKEERLQLLKELVKQFEFYLDLIKVD